MKALVSKWTARTLAGLALVVFCGTARADLSVSNSTTITSWNVINGQNPFYVSIPSASLGGASTSQGQPSAATGPNTVLSETLTITNGAGSLVIGDTNYVVTGIAILSSGGSANIAMHLYDVTTNLTSGNGTIYNGSGATYNFTANGDLLGNGNGLVYSNSLPGARQVFFTLSTGPTTQDQIVLGAGHTYALEFWTPTTASGAFNWLRNGGTPTDAGGQMMGSHDGVLSVARLTITSLGLAGGAPRIAALALYGYATNAALSVNNTTNSVPVTNLFVDAFNAPGFGPTNNFVGTNNYAAGQLINVWSNWAFATAWVTNEWDPASDANNNPNSGSMKITANFDVSNTQYLVYDYLNGLTPPLDGTRFTSFECDIRFDGTSATKNPFGTPIFGHLRFGTRTASFGQDYFGAVDVPASNTNWVHVNVPINAISDPNLTNINDVLIQIDSNFYPGQLSGPSILWVDNIKFVGPASVVPPPPPTLSIDKASPGLRIFAGDTSTISREEIVTVDQNASWISPAAYPVTYSFTIRNYPSLTFQGFQFHVFLIPLNYLRYAPYSNTFADFDATNNVWLRILTGAGNYAAQVAWKTNLPNSNPTNVVATLNTATAIGTWSVTFNSATSGTLTAPDSTFANFTIPADAAAQFANPLVAYFGLQPNTAGNVGQYVDLTRITVTNTAGTPVNDDFTDDSALDTGTWVVLAPAAQGQNIWMVPSDPAHVPSFWVNWTLPDFGYGLGISPEVAGPYLLSGFYSGFFDTPVAKGMGIRKWSLIGANNLPPDGSGGITNGFFRLANPAPPTF